MDHVADIITFGAIVKCTKCKKGNFVLHNSAYACNGDLSEWAKCGNLLKEPPRVPCKIPSSLQTDFPFLATERKVQTRALRAAAYIPPPRNAIKKEEGDDGVDGPRIAREKPPL